MDVEITYQPPNLYATTVVVKDIDRWMCDLTTVTLYDTTDKPVAVFWGVSSIHDVRLEVGSP